MVQPLSYDDRLRSWVVSHLQANGNWQIIQRSPFYSMEETMNPFQNFELWRLAAIAELVDCLFYLQSQEIENADNFCDRLQGVIEIIQSQNPPDEPKPKG